MSWINNFFAFLIAFLTISNLFGQERNNPTTIQISLPNKLNNQIFLDSTNYQSILVEYKDEKAITLSIFYKSEKKNDIDPDEFYDLTFEGDKFLLAKRFKVYPFYGNSQVGLIKNGIFVRPAYQKYKIRERTNIDNITFDIIMYSKSENELYTVESGQFPATYTEGNERLTSDIRLAFRLNQNYKERIKNTALLYRATVNRDGSLTDIKLISGEFSEFSDAIQVCIKATSGTWKPELQEGRSVKSFVDIFIQVNDKNELCASYSALNRR